MNDYSNKKSGNKVMGCFLIIVGIVMGVFLTFAILVGMAMFSIMSAAG